MDLNEAETIKELSEELISCQAPIRVLDSIKWDPEIQLDFFNNKCKHLPKINREYYRSRPPSFDYKEKLRAFTDLQVKIKKRLGQLSGVGKILCRMCKEYQFAIQLIQSRGTKNFYALSQELYGSTEDVFYIGGPNIVELAQLLTITLPSLKEKTWSEELDLKKYTAQEAIEILNQRLRIYFKDEDLTIRLSDNIYSDASAGAETLKLRTDAMFSERDIRLLEVHEGWVHLGTTYNGKSQKICTFLSKGTPSATVYQEGLAVLMELFTFTTYPARLERLTNRITAINMVENGANFLEVFHFFLSKGHVPEESYGLSTRVFRGSLPEGMGPFTKDIAYSKGFVLIYNYIRLAIQRGAIEQIPLLFLGKTILDDLPIYVDLLSRGLLELPKYVPPQFKDLAALSTWVSYSLFMNKLDLQKFSSDYHFIW